MCVCGGGEEVLSLGCILYSMSFTTRTKRISRRNVFEEVKILWNFRSVPEYCTNSNALKYIIDKNLC